MARARDRRRDPRAAGVPRRRVRAVADVSRERGTVVTSASKAFNLAGAEARRSSWAPSPRRSPRTLRDHAGLPRRARRRGGVPRRRRVAGRHDRDDRGQPARLPALLPAGVRVACRRAGELPGVAGLPRGRAGRRSGRGVPRARARGAVPRARASARGAGFARLNVGTTPELVEEAVRRTGAGSWLSSTTSTTWRAASARYSWCSGAREPSSQVTSTSVSGRKSSL